MGARSPVSTATLPATVFSNTVLIPQYTNGSAAGNPIFVGIPCVPGYSDLLSVHVSTVSDSTPYNYFNDSTVLSKQYIPYSINQVVNWPTVTPGSSFVDTSTNPTPKIPLVKQAWF
ncbi:hypothetical protein HDU98_004215, partial [Podochytrium sp. JEL0797]